MTSDKNKKSHIKSILQYALSFILTLALLYAAFHNVELDKVFEAVSHASIFWMIAVACTLMAAHILRAVRWKVILNSVKKDTSIKNLFGALMVGYAVNCVVPRLGEISRAVLIARWEGLSKSSMFGAVIVERVIDIIFLGLSVLISVFIWRQDLYASFPWLKSTLYITLLLMVVFIIFLYLTIKFKKNFYGIIVKLIGKISENLAHKAAHIFEMLTEGFQSLQGTKNYLLTFFLSVVIMLLYALSSFTGFFTLGMENTMDVSFGMAWVLMSISGIGVVIPTPGGTGSYHALAKAVLVLFGFSEVISLSYAFLTHAISYVIFIITGLICFFILNKKHESLIEVVETGVNDL